MNVRYYILLSPCFTSYSLDIFRNKEIILRVFSTKKYVQRKRRIILYFTDNAIVVRVYRAKLFWEILESGPGKTPRRKTLARHRKRGYLNCYALKGENVAVESV